jgi:PAS domain S-box-containing protein
VLVGAATLEEGGNQGVAFVLDLTERKRAEEALRESEYKLRQIIDTVPSLLWSVGPDGEPTHVSQQALDYSGMRLEDFKQRGWEAFLHPADFPETVKAFEHAIQTGTSYEAVHRLRRAADGEYRWHHARGEPLRDREGRIVQWYGLSIDIDERKRAEQALRESEGKFRDYAETASDWLWETGPDQKFTMLTANAFGSDPADRIGTTCWDRALDVETEPEKWRLVWATLEAHKPFRDFVFCTVGGSGAPMYVKSSGKPAFESSGKFRGYRGTCTDVTAIVRGQRAEASLRKVQAELAHVSRVTTLGQLTVSIAHEVMQPIGAARNNADAALNFLDRNPPDLGEVREALGSIIGYADRAGDIIHRIRDQIKKAPPRNDHFDLNQAIEEVIGLAQSIITDHGVSVQTQLASGMAPILGDRVQLQQVVLNLILNAVEAMSSVEMGERELLISTERTQSNGTLVAVCDSGPGIDPGRLELVFEAFYTTKSGGIGMGLSICGSIIDAHGGRLWAARNEPRGALFQFTLPSEAAN